MSAARAYPKYMSVGPAVHPVHAGVVAASAAADADAAITITATNNSTLPMVCCMVCCMGAYFFECGVRRHLKLTIYDTVSYALTRLIRHEDACQKMA